MSPSLLSTTMRSELPSPLILSRYAKKFLMKGCDCGIMSSKLALILSLVAWKPSTSVTSATSSSTRGRWLKISRSSASPDWSSKSAGFLMTGRSMRSILALMES